MLDLCTETIALADGRCSYAEARHVALDEERLAVADGRIDDAGARRSEGLGVRVRVGGGWGFAATRDVSRAGAAAALAQALAIAESQPAAPPRPLAPVAAARGHWASAWEVDPFALALEDKLGLLVAAEAALRATADPRLVRTVAEAGARRERKALATTEGAACTQEVLSCGGGLTAYAAADGEVQVRSYPLRTAATSAPPGGSTCARSTSRAPPRAWPRRPSPCSRARPARGHPDRRAARRAGRAAGARVHRPRARARPHPPRRGVLRRDELGAARRPRRPAGGALRYGSEQLTITADATLPGGLGTFGWDDEGVAARRTTLVDAGALRAALSDRESAAAIGLDASGGCARADGFARQPIVRMTNVSLEPGHGGTLEDLIAGTDDGIYFETNRSWSIDDRRLQFQFAAEVGREIRGGELGRLYRNPSYAGVTPRFWGGLEAVGSAPAWRLWGLTNCGKGEPGQVMAVSHGAAPVRVRDVEVGVA